MAFVSLSKQTAPHSVSARLIWVNSPRWSACELLFDGICSFQIRGTRRTALYELPDRTSFCGKLFRIDLSRLASAARPRGADLAVSARAVLPADVLVLRLQHEARRALRSGFRLRRTSDCRDRSDRRRIAGAAASCAPSLRWRHADRAQYRRSHRGRDAPLRSLSSDRRHRACHRERSADALGTDDRNDRDSWLHTRELRCAGIRPCGSGRNQPDSAARHGARARPGVFVPSACAASTSI